MNFRFCILILTMFLVLAGCSGGDPFSESNLSKMYIDYRKSGAPVGGMRSDKIFNAFYYDNIIEVQNFKKIKGYEKSPTEHYIEFTCDMVYRINSSDFESKFPKEKLKEVFGDKTETVAENMKKETFKAGEKKGRPINLAMILRKTDAGWEIKEMGFPNNQ